MPNKLTAWVTGHKTAAYAAGGAVLVAGYALYRRRAAAQAATAANITGAPVVGAYTPASASQLAPGTDSTTGGGADIQNLIDQSLGGIQDQINALQTAPAATDSTDLMSSLTQLLGGLPQQIAAAMPHGAVTPPPAAPRTATTVTFKAGDTLQSVAARAGVSTTALLAANPTSGANFAAPGHTVSLPGRSNTSGYIPTVVHTSNGQQTLAQIATEYGTTVAAIQKANPKAGRALTAAGERITIPGH